MRELILAAMAFLFVVGYGPKTGAQEAAAKPGEAAGGAAAKATRAGELNVMTFNLRFASNKAPNAWPARREAMRDQIRAADPDVFGTQEGVYAQLKDVEADLAGDYAWIGLGRDGGSKGEFMAVFYRRNRLEPVAYDHFWLSDTPNVIGSTTWGNTNRRMVTWVRFKDLADGRECYFWNTHLDHQIHLAIKREWKSNWKYRRPAVGACARDGVPGYVHGTQ